MDGSREYQSKQGLPAREEPTAPALVMLGQISEKNRSNASVIAADIEKITAVMLGEVKPLDPSPPSPYGGRVGEAIAQHNEIGFHHDRIMRCVERWQQALG